MSVAVSSGHALDLIGTGRATDRQHDRARTAGRSSADDPEAAHLDQAGQGVGRAAEEPAAGRSTAPPGRRRPAGSRRPARAAPGRSCRRRTGPRSARRASGRPAAAAIRPACTDHALRLAAGSTTKRAPTTSPSAPVRFSARMRAAVRLDDLAGDGEAEARVAAERRALGPRGVEPLEDRLQVLRRDARAVVVDGGDHLAARRAAGRPRTSPPGGLNERALSIRLRNTWPSGPSRPEHRDRLERRRRLEAHARRRPAWRWPGRGRRCRPSSRSRSSGLGRVARQLGVQARGVGDVGDQPVQPLDVLLQDAQQPLAGGRRP